MMAPDELRAHLAQQAASELPPSELAGPATGVVRRLGRFLVSRTLLREQPEQLKPLFSEMIVVEAQMRWERDSVEYLAMSDRFEVVEEGVMCPLYEITFRKDEEGRVTMHEVAKSLFA